MLYQRDICVCCNSQQSENIFKIYVYATIFNSLKNQKQNRIVNYALDVR